MTNIDLAVAYYTAMHNKDLAGLDKYLHSDVRFIGPMAESKGKEAVLKAAEGFMNFFKSITIRAQFGSGNQAMLAYDLDCPAPVGTLRAATLFTFDDGLIKTLELFYDATLFQKHREEIFGSK